MHISLLGEHSWIGWIIVGGLAGLIAKAIMPGRDPGGCIVTILLGIAGAVVGGWIGRKLHLLSNTEGAGFITAVLGAIIILFVYRLVANRRY
jgi:uncharacterized membrane protein YeaQ/YmgE (transglycosylase-associated protein family)